MSATKVFVVMFMIFTVGCIASADWYLLDDFSGPSVDTNTWAVTTAGTSTATIDSGRLHLNSPAVASGSHGTMVLTNDTFTIAESSVSNSLNIAFDAELGTNAAGTYGNAFNVYKDSSVLVGVQFLSSNGNIYVANGNDTTYQTYARDFRNVPVHVQIFLGASSFGVKIFNVAAGYTPTDYTDATANLADTTPGGLLAYKNNYTSILTGGGSITTADELTLRAAGCAVTTNTARVGDMYYDNVYTTVEVPEPMTIGLLALGAGGMLFRKRK